jgi:hypothetical protein
MRFVNRPLKLLLTAVAFALPCGVASAATPIGAYTTKGAWSFVSAPKLHPPKLGTTRPTNFRQLAPGFFFVANFPNLTATQPPTGKGVPLVGQSGPMILDSHLRPVWFNPVPKNVLALDLKLQSFDGKPALSWWQGVINNVGVNNNGTDIVVDQHYRKIAQVTGQGGWLLSEHELAITGHDGWVTSYKPVQMNLTPYGGPATGTVLDSAVQEYDLKTGRLLFTWDALQHIPLTQSQTRPAGPVPWDAYHVNSVQPLSGGRFLVSMRNTWGAYLVDARSGNIVWTLSGNPSISSFSLPSNARFTWQHDVQMLSGNRVSLFDDACCAIVGPGKFGNPSGPSRGLVLKLDTSHHSATMAAQYTRGRNFEAAFLGSTQLLPNGNAVVGWGSRPYFSEFSKTGKLLLDAVWPGPDLSYRAFVQSWTGKPFFPPSGAVRTRHGVTTVYASWDGATQVAAWRVLAGPNAKHLKVIVAGSGKRGFETAIRIKGHFRVYRIKALSSRGRVLGTSGVFPKRGGHPSLPGFY